MIGEGVKNRGYSTLAIGAGLGVFVMFAGCMTLEQMAPPVGIELQKVGSRHGVEMETLELGREIYLSGCVKCHSVEPIGRYSVEQWRHMLPKMLDKTLLFGEDASALETYVTLANVLLAETAKAETETAQSRKSASVESGAGTYSTHRGG